MKTIFNKFLQLSEYLIKINVDYFLGPQILYDVIIYACSPASARNG